MSISGRWGHQVNTFEHIGHVQFWLCNARVQVKINTTASVQLHWMKAAWSPHVMELYIENLKG